jgi:hypothetical protein
VQRFAVLLGALEDVAVDLLADGNRRIAGGLLTLVLDPEDFAVPRVHLAGAEKKGPFFVAEFDAGPLGALVNAC